MNTPAKSLATPTHSSEPIRADWISVVRVKENRALTILRASLGTGEIEAIMLAMERGLHSVRRFASKEERLFD